MSRESVWTNNDGLDVGFGTRDSKNENAATVRTQGNINIWQFPFDYDTVDVIGTDTPSSKSIPIPARAVIQRATFTVTEVFAGGTDVDFGLMDSAGVAIDDDGLDAAVATAALNAVGEVVQMDGALVGSTVDVGASDAYFGVVYNGTYTAGKGIVLVEFVLPMPDSDATDPITTIVGSL